MWGTTSVWPQEGDEIQHRAVSVGLGFRGSAHPLLAVGPWVLHPQAAAWGGPVGAAGHPVLLCPGLAAPDPCFWASPVAPGSKEGGNRQFACLGLWLSFLPSPPPLLFLCSGGCFSPPFLFGVAGLHLIPSALSQLLTWP